MLQRFSRRAAALAVVSAVLVLALSLLVVPSLAQGATVHKPHNSTIPQGSIAVFKWTFSPALAQAETATFQISKDKVTWRTLKTYSVAAGATSLRTKWQAPDKVVTRYFRLDVGGNISPIVIVHVK